jgi:hypothetical protein
MNISIRSGHYVMMMPSLIANLYSNGSKNHALEFKNSVGVVVGATNYNDPNSSIIDKSKFGPEVDVKWLPSMLRYSYLPGELREVFSIKRLHTKQLLARLVDSRIEHLSGFNDIVDRSESLTDEFKLFPYFQISIDGESWGTIFSYDQLKKELALRPHVNNKQESRTDRIKKKSSGR